MIELLRSDLRTERPAIVLANMDLTEDQRKLFMPVFDAFTARMKEHWEARLKLLDDYADAKETLTDKQATSFMKRLFELEREDTAIREEYAEKMTEVLPPTVAARWAQIERRLVKMMELQVANEVPVVPVKE